MSGRYLIEILGIDARHALYREDGKWYHHLKGFPGVLFDKGGYVIFHTQQEYINHPSLCHTQDLHVDSGISSLSNYQLFSESEIRKIAISNGGDEETVRIIRQSETLVRNTKLVRDIKKLYEYTCQICTIQLEIGTNVYYAEVHHVRPLGGIHRGPDKIENMICVCPNCHILLDLGVLELNSQTLQIIRHPINEHHILYYNQEILTRRIQ